MVDLRGLGISKCFLQIRKQGDLTLLYKSISYDFLY